MSNKNHGKPAGKPFRRDGVDPVLRSRARRRALQAIYAWQISGGNAESLLAQFAHEQAHEVADLAYFENLLRGVLDHRRELDEALVPFLDRPVEEVDAIERAICRSRSDRGCATPRPPAARLPRLSPALGMRARQ